MDWAACSMALAFAGVFTALMIGKHDSLHSFAFDLGSFDQAIWTTLHGRFLYNTLQNRSLLANHFSPLMALLAPLFLIWSNVRVLFVFQAAGLAAAGLILYLIVRTRHPLAALGFLAAFYINPALHEVALVEFRRITLAVPFFGTGALWTLQAQARVDGCWVDLCFPVQGRRRSPRADGGPLPGRV
jgi:uncharacterized membrane protein